MACFGTSSSRFPTFLYFSIFAIGVAFLKDVEKPFGTIVFVSCDVRVVLVERSKRGVNCWTGLNIER